MVNSMEKYSDRFSIWKRILYLNHSFNQVSDFDDGEFDANELRVSKFLAEVLSIAQKESKVKEQFSAPKLAPILVGNAITITSDKLNLEITFGIFKNEFYLESSFNYPEHMGKVDDDFWFTLANMSKLGMLKFQENASPATDLSEKLEKKHRALKSSVLAAIQNYIICVDDDCINDGGLEISWKINTDFCELLSNLSGALGCIYKLNYQLYRRNYILEKSRNKCN
ncbi:hypothetical protein VCSRO96_3040 [Vibrio cholerae]|nr:hypothetical protein VCSRO96_3040 [Vibrio cholerae]